MSQLQGWADLPDDLLHSIIPRLGSIPNLIAFAATCPSWRAFFSFYPSKSTLLPPLLLQPDVPGCSPRPRPFTNSTIPKRSCYVTDLTNQNTYMCCQIPQFSSFSGRKSPPSPLDGFCFGALSRGHLILTNQKQSCLVVDVLISVSVFPPQLPDDEYIQLNYVALTTPLASPNSHLLVTTGRQNFFWPVGSHSWLRCSRHIGVLKQIVVFKGQVFGIDYDHKLYIMHLVDQIHTQQIAVDWEGSMTDKWRLSHPWLVACGEMLLLVGHDRSLPSTERTFEAFQLDLSSEPAKWVKVEKLENWAIFINTNKRNQPFCCMNPERWGGRSNCIYCYSHDSKNCIPFELGKTLQGDASTPSVSIHIDSGSMMQPMWVVPSMFY